MSNACYASRFSAWLCLHFLQHRHRVRTRKSAIAIRAASLAALNPAREGISHELPKAAMASGRIQASNITSVRHAQRRIANSAVLDLEKLLTSFVYRSMFLSFIVRR